MWPGQARHGRVGAGPGDKPPADRDPAADSGTECEVDVIAGATAPLVFRPGRGHTVVDHMDPFFQFG
jgi:hypothetical protein